jgi:hypothetical protein
MIRFAHVDAGRVEEAVPHPPVDVRRAGRHATSDGTTRPSTSRLTREAVATPPV